MSYNKQQQKERPPVRQIAEQFLGDDLRAQLEPFLRHIEENRIPFSLARCNAYESKYKSRPVFRLEIAQGQACVPDVYHIKVFTCADKTHLAGNLDEFQANLADYLASLEGDMADYYIEHQVRCRACGKCKPGVELELFGKRYPAVCASGISVMQVKNPSESDYAMIYRFIDARRRFIEK